MISRPFENLGNVPGSLAREMHVSTLASPTHTPSELAEAVDGSLL